MSITESPIPNAEAQGTGRGPNGHIDQRVAVLNTILGNADSVQPNSPSESTLYAVMRSGRAKEN